jgi:acyl-CoA thioester hydrolase
VAKKSSITHKTTHRVRYSDTDKMGFVYNANYLRWFEIGRSEFLPLSEVHCKFNTPSRYDDVLVVKTTLDTSVRAGFKFDYQVYNEDEKDILATGYTKHACVDSSGRVVRPPAFIKAALNRSD